MALNECNVVCQSDLKSDLMTSFTEVDLTQVTDRTCNNVMYLTDDPGLIDVADAASGQWLDAGSPRSRIVVSFDEIKMHYAPSSQVYEAAEQFFLNSGNRQVTSYFFIGFWDRANGEGAATALDLIAACQPCWLHLTVAHFDIADVQLMDDVEMLAIAEWAIINDRIPYFLSIDPLNEDPSDATTLKAQLTALGLVDSYVHYTQGECRTVTDPVTGQVVYFAAGDPVVDEVGNPVIDPNTGVQAISDGTEPMLEIIYPYHEFLAAGWAGNVDFSQTNSGYTLAYKPLGGLGWIGLRTDQFNNSQVSSVTGVFPNGFVNTNNNGHANVYVQTAGYPVLFNGMTVGGSWLNQLHLSLWLKQRIKDELATLMVQQRRIPYDDARGQALLVSAVARVLAEAQGNGHFTNDPQPWENTGIYVRKGTGWVIRQDSFNDQTASRKNQRVSPALSVCYIPAGAVHHVPVTLCTLAVPTAV